jgi:predicted O-methyltransferase YrrM
MHKRRFRQILKMITKAPDLLSSGDFGQGLWPVDIELGQFMYWLIRIKGLKMGIEVGAGVGYSTFWIAQALYENGGKLITFEYFPPKVSQLEEHLSHFFGKNYTDFIDIVPAGFNEGVRHLGREKFDFVFFDQRKSDYLQHLQKLLPKLRKGAFICADNVTSHEKASRPYLEFVRNDSRFQSQLINVGAGMEMSRYSA